MGRLGGWEVVRLGGWEMVRLGGWEVVRLGGWEVGRWAGWEVWRLTNFVCLAGGFDEGVGDGAWTMVLWNALDTPIECPPCDL